MNKFKYPENFAGRKFAKKYPGAKFWISGEYLFTNANATEKEIFGMVNKPPVSEEEVQAKVADANDLVRENPLFSLSVDEVINLLKNDEKSTMEEVVKLVLALRDLRWQQ